jgi:hypothetical protein
MPLTAEDNIIVGSLRNRRVAPLTFVLAMLGEGPEAMPATAINNNTDSIVTHFDFSPGMRQRELRGLRWSDVDLEAGVIHVRQRAEGLGTMGPPKSKAGKQPSPQ